MKGCLVLALAGLFCRTFTCAQEPTASAPQVATISTEVGRVEGIDVDNHVAYVRLFISGVLVPSVQKPDASTVRPPMLTAQCTRQPSGKLGFELFTNFDGADDHLYHRPWMPQDGGLFAPTPGKAIVTMEFVGYTHVKPVKRQWERLDKPVGELRYSSPGAASSNMEDIAYYLQYLKSLPTLRLTYDGKRAEFLTTALFKQLAAEPLCRASGL